MPFNLSKAQKLGSSHYPGNYLGLGRIRVLILIEVTLLNRLKCLLTEIDLPSAGQGDYAALSYRWTLGGAHEIISCNGTDFRVHSDVVCALRQIWISGKQPRLPIWIDAVCINQKDFKEFESQVRVMREIFQRADHVIVWLGNSDSLFRRAWTAMHTVLVSEALPDAEKTTRSMLKAIGTTQELWGAIENLWATEWFHRVWTLQEIYLARRATLRCSTDTMDWNDFMKACHILAHHTETGLDGEIMESKIQLIRRLSAYPYRLPASKTSFELLYLLAMTVHRKSTDPRDKIYGLLGLVLGPSLEDFIVDYESEPEAIYTIIARALIIRASWTEPDRTGSEPFDLSILHAAGLDSHDGPSSDGDEVTWGETTATSSKLPSWVPDWTKPSISWTSHIFDQKDEWVPLIRTDGLKHGCALRKNSTGDELHVVAVVLGSFQVRSVSQRTRTEFVLHELPTCTTAGLKASTVSSKRIYTRWTDGASKADLHRYPNDESTPIYDAPDILRQLRAHDDKTCLCFRTPEPAWRFSLYTKLVIFWSPFFISYILFYKEVEASAVFAFLIAGGTAFLIMTEISATKKLAIAPMFRVDWTIKDSLDTRASRGDWLVSLAGKQGMFLLKPRQDGKFKLVTAMLRHKHESNLEIAPLTKNWKSKARCRNGGHTSQPSWEDFQVVPVFLTIT
ncbi:heterokaryon incompatibility protein-domain-containing protein [Xylariaceae sp. FL1272]|nr:heterokaryon incompatibility protein-domain-containing protein [Xylariaceae sp. FL1272]